MHAASQVQAVSPCTLVGVMGEDNYHLTCRTCPVTVLRAHVTLFKRVMETVVLAAVFSPNI